MTVKFHTLAQITAAWLSSSRMIDCTSLTLTLLAACGIFWGATASFAQFVFPLVILLGIVEKVYAVRVAFDQRLFARWASQWESSAAVDLDAELALFDEALTEMGLRQGGATGRNYHDRIRGACTLFRRQAWCLALQFAAVLAFTFNYGLLFDPVWLGK